ncbi:MAG TPA: hypothetical protein VLA49_01670 [Anaerolineales bacterium]|nr:hypothetical protein [Anaerolineales bacterium]
METPGFYEIRVAGQLTARWSDWFDGLEILNDSNGETVLIGSFIDQAALLGTLNKIQGLNLTLISVRRSPVKG